MRKHELPKGGGTCQLRRSLQHNLGAFTWSRRRYAAQPPSRQEHKSSHKLWESFGGSLQVACLPPLISLVTLTFIFPMCALRFSHQTIPFRCLTGPSERSSSEEMKAFQVTTSPTKRCGVSSQPVLSTWVDDFWNSSSVFYVYSRCATEGTFISLFTLGFHWGIMHWMYITQRWDWDAAVRWTMITSCATGPASFFKPAWAISPFPRIGAFDAQFTSLPEHILLGTEPITK